VGRRPRCTLELIPFALYLAALVLMLPAAPFAIACLVLNHAIVVRNPFRIFYDILRVAVWFIPIFIVAFLALLVCALFPAGRHYGSFGIALLDASVAAIILISVNRPNAGAQAVPLLPAVVSFLLAISLAARLL
jgi:hypothetical protein